MERRQEKGKPACTWSERTYGASNVDPRDTRWPSHRFNLVCMIEVVLLLLLPLLLLVSLALGPNLPAGLEEVEEKRGRRRPVLFVVPLVRGRGGGGGGEQQQDVVLFLVLGHEMGITGTRER